MAQNQQPQQYSQQDLQQYMQLGQYPPQNYGYPPNYPTSQQQPYYGGYTAEQYQAYLHYAAQQQQQANPYAPNPYPAQPSSSAHSERTIWIGNLHAEVNEAELKECFIRFGNIENVKLVRNKACGFVTFVDRSAAATAHNEMSKKLIHGQEVKLGWGKAENTSSQPVSGGYPVIGPANYQVSTQHRIPDINKELPHMEPSRSIWIGNVTPSVTEQVLRDHFSPFGAIESIRLMLPKNCAFITFQSVEMAKTAKETMDKQRVVDTQIRINYGKI